ncbi:MAG: hypothetical protein HYX54_06965 [Chloroflexi bacterium]|nr:hypothetical protein [Chloroflexota bacterium]
MRRIPGLLSNLVTASVAPVVPAISTLPFLPPAWAPFREDRSEAVAWTGLSAADLRPATDRIRSDRDPGPAAGGGAS